MSKKNWDTSKQKNLGFDVFKYVLALAVYHRIFRSIGHQGYQLDSWRTNTAN